MSAQVARQLEDLSRQLERAGKKAERRGKRKDWHRLRTTSRRLRGALTAFAGALDPSLRPRLAKRAKQITKLPAKVRDLDVALRNLALLADRAGSRAEGRALADMTRHLERQRDRKDRKARRKLRRGRPVRTLARQVREALQPGAARQGFPAGGALEACAREVLDRRAEVGGWSDEAALHALRVAAKKYRGTLSAWAEAHRREDDHRSSLASLGALLDTLGEHHDWSELAHRLDRRRQEANPGAQAGYRALLGRVRQEQKAWHQDYLARFHDRLPALVSHSDAAEPATVH
jgi:CHAD domain-containing protein